MQPDTVAGKLEDKINYKIILLIISAVISFQILMYFIEDDEKRDLIISIVSIINPVVASIAGFLVAKRYGFSKTFGKAYFALGCGYMFAGLGEIVYLVFVIPEIQTFPSIADVVFFLIYPFILAHLVICIRFFKPKLTFKEILWMTLIPILLVGVYIILSLEQIEEINLESSFGIIYVLEPAVVLPIAILGAKVFKGGIIGTPWILLALAIITLTVGDTWYSYLVIFKEYDLVHPVNVFWYIGYWIVVYALYKHKKSL